MPRKTAVNWLMHALIEEFGAEMRTAYENNQLLLENIGLKAEAIERDIATEYAEFCVRCDRAQLPLVKFEDWLKELKFPLS